MLAELSASMPDLSWMLTAVIAVLTLIMVRHLLQVWSLPPGPFPLPGLGNILMLRGEGNELRHVFSALMKKHKDMFSFWIGPKPSIVVCSWDLCHQGLVVKRNEFSGRVVRHFAEILLQGQTDAAFSDLSPGFETLKKVLSTAIRKYAGSVNLAELVSDVVDRTTDTMLKDSNSVDSATFMYLTIYNVLSSSSFGVRFELNDPVFMRLRKNNDDLLETLGNGLPTDALPILKPFYRKRVQQMEKLADNTRQYIRQKLKEHQASFQSGDIRDFTDAILSAKEEAIAEGKESAQYLTDGNLLLLLMNLFAAGTDTTRVMLMWTFLVISNTPEIQSRMQEEIDRNIGSRQPLQSDKNSCPYVHAVLTESLRFRPVLDFTLEHKTIQDTELGGYKIPKDTSVFFYIRGPQSDESAWKDAHLFKPERFLDENGQFTNARIANYLPFGLGRRSCPGEKLALANSFLITTRLLQKYNFSLEGGPGSGNYDLNEKLLSNAPLNHKLILTSRN